MAFRPGYGKVDRDYGLRMATMDPADDGPVWMVNLMKYKEVASYVDGNPTGISGKEADDRYAPTAILREIGAEVPFFGDVIDQPVGDDVRWDRIGVVKYPTRRSFIDMQSRQDFKGKHEHKEAGMEFTFVIGCLPVDPASLPSTRTMTGTGSGNEAVVLLQVLRLADGAPIDLHDRHRREAEALGGAPVAWFAPEGTIMGDGRSWDAVRFTGFGSVDIAVAAANDMQRSARAEASVLDAYAMVVRPSINRF